MSLTISLFVWKGESAMYVMTERFGIINLIHYKRVDIGEFDTLNGWHLYAVDVSQGILLHLLSPHSTQKRKQRWHLCLSLMESRTISSGVPKVSKRFKTYPR